MGGARLVYTVGHDPQKGEPIAENVMPEMESHIEIQPQEIQFAGMQMPEIPSMQEGWCTGTMLKDNGSFGFIKQDSGQDDMFVMPVQCLGLGTPGMLPPIGTRLIYRVTVDLKTGRLRAEDVQLEGEHLLGMPLGAMRS